MAKNNASVSSPDFFAGLGAASQGGVKNYVNGGTYLVEILSMVGSRTRKDHRVVITECRVHEVILALPAEDGFAASNRVGETVSVFVDLDSEFPDMDLGKLKGQLVAVLGDGIASTDAEWSDLAAKVCTPPGHALAGERMMITATRTTTKGGRKIASLVFSAAPSAKV